jgi:hypothetical protein
VDLQEELVSLVSALDAGTVDYALIGGMAVAVWGAPRFTQHIDLLIQRADLLRRWGTVRHLQR